MVKIYTGIALAGWPGTVLVEDKPGQGRALTHHVYHSPDGFSWGYGGSGPSELAKDILWDLLGKQPSPTLYHAFKDEFIATIPQKEGWMLTENQIRAWLATRVPEEEVVTE